MRITLSPSRPLALALWTTLLVCGGQFSTVSAKQAADTPNKDKAALVQSANPETTSKKEEKTEETRREEETSAAMDVREKELALQRLKLTQKCAAAELSQKKEKAQRKLSEAKEDLAQFQTKGKELALSAAKLQLTRAHDQYEYKLEELKQLKQMYTEDQLTDTSEEIILKRSTREVEDAKFAYDGKVITTQFEIDVKIPRQEQELKDSVAVAQNELDKVSVDSQMAEQENTLSMDKAQAALDKARSTGENKKKELQKNS